ncbi:hypothetical protein [Kordiimonas aquimaris]|uniref:hypothetical protein n=1 Tax=Kordiimonas aquimaris TaxID=707591 RepID=UPI0021D353AB|nr:hypothetical protein [Kordiimonas aquimaris]
MISQKMHAIFKPFTALALGVFASMAVAAQEIETVTPGNAAFSIENIPDYEARYTSSSSKTGEFTLHVRTTGNGEKLSMIDIIPMENMVIVAQRFIDIQTQLLEFYAGPYFAWGPEYIVGKTDGKTYDWSRTPIAGGAPKRASGDIAHNGYVSEMFSPLLASLMPRDVGSVFQMPGFYARKGEYVSSEMDVFMVTGRETLTTPSGLSCECWVIDKKTWNGSLERIWVARTAPYVFKRHRDVGGSRSFVSDLLSYRPLDK